MLFILERFVFNKLTRSINCSFIIFSLGAALSACGSSSSSSSSTVPGINYAHNLVFKDGTLLSTGYNAFGQLGNGTTDSRNAPGTLSGGNLFTGFATGGNHSVAFTADGEVFSWGNNAYGQLGTGATANSSVPVKTLDVSDVKAVAAGAFHTLGLGGDGSVWAWGWNNYGQLGYTPDPGYSANPAKVVFSNGSTNVRAVAANGYNSMALANGTVWTWGLNGTGQLGRDPLDLPSSPTPVAVPGLAGITAIASGSAFSYALASDTTVWAWGNNSNGQLGDGTVLDAPESGTDVPSGCVAVSADNSYKPVQVKKAANSELTNIVQVAAGYHHGLARLADDTVWAWGANVLGQLGNQTYGGNNCFAVQVRYEDGAYLLAKDIRAFGSSSMALTADGAWYAWGNNIYGQLGIGSNETALYPVKMSGF